jgi:hypothetical protein
MKKTFKKLDQPTGTLRILYTLIWEAPGNSRKELEEAMKSNGVGRNAFYTGIKVLKELDLIKEEKRIENGKNTLITSLTQSGTDVALIISEIYDKLK